MTGRVEAAMVELETELATLEDTFGKPVRDVGSAPGLPALVMGPPIVQFEGAAIGPTGLQAIVWVVVAMDARALERLWAYVELVAETVDKQTADWVVRQASPSVYPAGGTDLPAYQIQCEAGMS
jgi:hypothetical protein